MSLTAAQMKRIADLSADQQRDRVTLSLRQSNERDELLQRQAADRARLLGQLGITAEQVDQAVQVDHQVAGNTAEIAPTTSTRRVLSPAGAAARRPR